MGANPEINHNRILVDNNTILYKTIKCANIRSGSILAWYDTQVNTHNISIDLLRERV